MQIIECNLSQDFDTLELYPLSDLHIGDPRVDKELFKKFKEHIKAQPNRYLIYAGDNMNNAIKTSVSNVYNEEMSPREQKKFLIEQLEDIKDRFFVFVAGNHEERSAKETDTYIVEDIADKLGLIDRYREDEAYLKISFGKKNDTKKRVYTVYCVHGNGGGKRPGSALNNIELLSLSIEADIYVMGHVHKKMAYKNAYRKVDLHNNVITEQERLFVVSSHWSSFGGYAARKMLTPSAKGSVPIILYAREKRMEAVI